MKQGKLGESMFALDANIFLEFFLKQERAPECKELLLSIFENKIQAVVSDTTLVTIAFNLERCGQSWLEIRKFFLSLSRYEGLHIYIPSLPDKVFATDFMRDYKLDFDDALTLQASIASGCDTLISFDKDFAKIPIIKCLAPAQVLGK